jgi:hypothetical protein
MVGCLYTCSACKDYCLYAPSGLPTYIRDPIICSKCGHKMRCVEADMEKGNKVRNVHLGSCRKMGQADALAIKL